MLQTQVEHQVGDERLHTHALAIRTVRWSETYSTHGEFPNLDVIEPLM